ncbi:hypothetical protein TOPH_08336 [Tolypocladium ophioglossoides CBS 100239]|uniref:DUF1774-domain-containing protein n=1 Tax=Tolypocladium ophioglossoides (strain CBS 100239) TaxID=1163406 RepID=A0A0L0MYU2_TOLOC|nr:hypothetical protein TOPH_08336 [Tolypocladium ophioglossoides CBS 100239]
MAKLKTYNPFARREVYTPRSILAYQAFASLSLVVSICVSVCFAVIKPDNNAAAYRVIWDQNYLHPNAFTMDSSIGNTFWIALFLVQFGYIGHFHSDNTYYKHEAASVAAHFVSHNVLHTTFILLFAHSCFYSAEVILILNFVNLSWLYFRHNCPLSVHIPVVCGPLAWSFASIYWNGAIAVTYQSLATRILGFIFIWSILAYGLFFLAAYKDFTMTLCLSILSAAIGVGQLLTQPMPFRWAPPFIITAVLFTMSIIAAISKYIDKQSERSSAADDEKTAVDDERDAEVCCYIA